MKICPSCGDEIKGRSDKKFCTSYCKSNFHYSLSLQKEENLFRKIDNQLRLNRRLLKNYNKSGMSVVRKEALIEAGFNPKFFTHYWKNQKGDVYLFCFEYGFLEKKEDDKIKYILVQWQEYMNN